MFRKISRLVLCSVVAFSICSLYLCLQEASATNYILDNPASCLALAGSWNTNFSRCDLTSLTLNSGDMLIVNSTMNLEITGVITNNGAKVYNYGNLEGGGFSVIYNNIGGSIYNYGAITTSGGTINNYAPIYNYGYLGNYGSIYNYGTIYNYNASTIDDKFGVVHNENGTIDDNCGAVFEGIEPYGDQVKNTCSVIQSGQTKPEQQAMSGAILPPLQQFRSGTNAKDVVCSKGLQLVIKMEDGSPACVRPGTAQKLAERKWSEPVS